MPVRFWILSILMLILSILILTVPAVYSNLQGVNVALNKAVLMSSTKYCCESDWYLFNGSMAVDGVIAGSAGIHDANHCRCCSSTDFRPNNWLILDLGEIVPIHSVVVTGRPDNSETGRLKSLQIYLSNTTGNMAGTRVYLHADNDTSQQITITFSDDYPAQFVKLLQPRADELMVCELQVFKTDCDSGNYGRYCGKTCGQCRNMSECNKTNGTCMTGCLPGYKPGLCDEECKTGWYGMHCLEKCGLCANINNYDKKTGECLTGCHPGFKPPLCKETCTNQTFGVNCGNRCHCRNGSQCDVLSGTCPDLKCDLGYTYDNCTKCYTYTNIIQLLGRNFTTAVSDKAVDDDLATCFTVKGLTSGWSIDLLNKFLVESVLVFTNKSQPGQTNDLQLAIGNSSEAMDIRVGSTAISFGQTLFSLDIPRPLKVVNIWNNASDSMTLCEVKVLEKYCEMGHYGYNCSRRCYCMDQTSCHPVTGQCNSPLCQPGWKGHTCGEECPDGWYGQIWRQSCGNCLVPPCDKVDGNCTEGCLGDWLEPVCTETNSTAEASDSKGLIIGLSVGIPIAVTAAIIVTVIIRRNRCC